MFFEHFQLYFYYFGAFRCLAKFAKFSEYFRFMCTFCSVICNGWFSCWQPQFFRRFTFLPIRVEEIGHSRRGLDLKISFVHSSRKMKQKSFVIGVFLVYLVPTKLPKHKPPYSASIVMRQQTCFALGLFWSEINSQTIVPKIVVLCFVEKFFALKIEFFA